MNEAQYFDYINLYFNGEITDEENAILQQWLQASPENRKKFSEIERLWLKSKPEQPASIPGMEHAWKQIEAKIIKEEKKKPAQVYPPHTRHRGLYRTGFWVGAAAIFLIFAVITFFNRDRNHVYSAGRGHQIDVTLPDESVVALNADSELIYLNNPSDSMRMVTLRGQGFFKVAHDGRPFMVKTGNAMISVLGTSFDVFARGNKTVVFVKEGRVELKPLAGDSLRSVIIEANQKCSLADGRLPDAPTTVEPDYMIGWLDNRFVFYKTPLTDIIEEMQRRYDIEISLQPQTLGRQTVSGSFLEQSVDSTLSSLCFTLDLTYRFDDGTYVISGL